ncbi:hypothetical protein Halha_2492 [Halobacteroides halobius DSM 5150]|uniref:DUF1934 domain-containing protein n=1 Tax=Halobacteroides halobius (strain ATCC 35273 / DSM 5150 / MD-1) TaxID=748449 RepID=L0KBJ3_HALHC|nr:DUF1934 domain-containing protein [Halobacteroides halobius]AGB42366.1 hypothetical protein Halha_2492 [Halobacteroides halobius DSM 5150]
MTKEVSIKITGKQKNGTEETEINNHTKGKFYNKQGTYYLRYQEEAKGLKGVNTTLKIEDNQVTLIRQGKVRTIQEFMPQTKTKFDYKTPYGRLELEIEVEILNVNIGSRAGEINLKYQLYDKQGLIGTNWLNIVYKEE